MAQEFENAASCWKAIMSDVSRNKGLLSVIEKFARENTNPTHVVFGTSGWRGETGSDFTFNNMRVVTSAIIEMFKSKDSSVMKAMGVSGFEEIQKRGVIVGHDNRFLGPEFAMEVIGLLQKDGIKTWYAGEAPTPEFSVGIEMVHAACSINLTPSHNPANYSGFKFNPSDGGPAGTEITTRIEEIANRMMSTSPFVKPIKPEKGEEIDLTGLYIQFIKERKTLDIEKIRDFVNREDCIICVDNVYGSTRGRIERILGECKNIKYLRTENDFLFDGIAPEPSEKNMQGVEKVLKESKARFKLGVAMDPDGDRIRYADGSMQIPMNYFGAMAVKETKVGFKNFRPYMLKTSRERAIVAFEESDGISAYNHILEKDAIFGLLLAIEMMAVTGKNLSEYLKDLMDEFGYYYPDRSGISVDPTLVGEPLIKKISVIGERYKKGTVIPMGKISRTVKNVITEDGIKLVFDDGSWLMIRPSGTEPKVRFYIEARTEEGKQAVFETAERMTRDALGMAR
ncbi:MAG: phosphomannomutase [Nitrospirae bacterium]|nr:phosphomannomutase [Nitrospirota bacterium]